MRRVSPLEKRIKVYTKEQIISVGRLNPVQPLSKQIVKGCISPELLNNQTTSEWEKLTGEFDDADLCRYPPLHSNQTASIMRGGLVFIPQFEMRNASAYRNESGENLIPILQTYNGMTYEQACQCVVLGVANGEIDATDPQADGTAISIHGIEQLVNKSHQNFPIAARVGVRPPSVIKDTQTNKFIPSVHVRMTPKDRFEPEFYEINIEAAIEYMALKSADMKVDERLMKHVDDVSSGDFDLAVRKSKALNLFKAEDFKTILEFKTNADAKNFMIAKFEEWKKGFTECTSSSETDLIEKVDKLWGENYDKYLGGGTANYQWLYMAHTLSSLVMQYRTIQYGVAAVSLYSGRSIGITCEPSVPGAPLVLFINNGGSTSSAT
jgi:hypothetical protein